MDEILALIKNMLGVSADYDGFDAMLLVLINSAIFNLYQLGMDSASEFVADAETTWVQLIGDTDQIDELVKKYVYFKTRLDFDPPGTSFLIASMERQIEELSTRIMVELDPVY